jgi:hypothetical protein
VVEIEGMEGIRPSRKGDQVSHQQNTNSKADSPSIDDDDGSVTPRQDPFEVGCMAHDHPSNAHNLHRLLGSSAKGGRFGVGGPASVPPYSKSQRVEEGRGDEKGESCGR